LKSSKAAQAFELIEQFFSIEKGFEGMPQNEIYTTRLKKTNPFVIGRKNWLFSDTDKGADSSAVIFSL